MIISLSVLALLSLISLYLFLNKGHYFFLGMVLSNSILIFLVAYGYLNIEQLHYSVLNRVGSIRFDYLTEIVYYFVYPVFLLFVISLLIERKRVRSFKIPIGVFRIPHPVEIAFISFMISLVVFLLSDTVLDYPYPLQKPGVVLPNFLVNANAFISYLALYSVSSRSDILAKFLLLVLFIAATVLGTLLTSGSRGVLFALVFLLCLQQLLIIKDRFKIADFLILFVLIAYAVFLFSLWPYLRGDLYQSGFLDSFILSINRAFFRSDGLSFFDSIPMFPQSIFHFIYVVHLNLNESGKDSIDLVNFVYQQLPSFLDGYFYDRPLNDAYALMDYFFHGGGFFYLANLAWYGNYFSFVFSVSLLVFIVYLFETRFPMSKNGDVFCYYFSFLIFIVGLFYGIQPLLRSFQIGILLLTIFRFYELLTVRRRR